jgi:hypothetical protein
MQCTNNHCKINKIFNSTVILVTKMIMNLKTNFNKNKIKIMKII